MGNLGIKPKGMGVQGVRSSRAGAGREIPGLLQSRASFPNFLWFSYQNTCSDPRILLESSTGCKCCSGSQFLLEVTGIAEVSVLGHGGIHSPAGIQLSIQAAPAAPSLYPCPLWHWDVPRESCEGPVLNLSHSPQGSWKSLLLFLEC